MISSSDPSAKAARPATGNGTAPIDGLKAHVEVYLWGAETMAKMSKAKIDAGTLADGASAAAVRQVTGGRVKEFRRKMQDLARRGQPPVDLGFPDNDPGKDGAEEATKAGMDAIVTGKTDNSPGNTNGDEPKLAS